MDLIGGLRLWVATLVHYGSVFATWPSSDPGFARPTFPLGQCHQLKDFRFGKLRCYRRDSILREILKLMTLPYILRPDSLDQETREFFRQAQTRPRITYSAKDDYAVMAMVERGLGISILPELLLRRTPYKVAKRELDPPATRQIGIACKSTASLPPAARQFLQHIKQALPL